MRARFVRFKVDGTTTAGATNLLDFYRERRYLIWLQTTNEILLAQKLREGNQPAVSLWAAGIDEATALGDIAGAFQQ